MRLGVFWLGLCACLSATAGVRAGVHNPAEPPLLPEKDLTTFLGQQLAAIRGYAPSTGFSGTQVARQREDFLEKVKALRAKQAREPLDAKELASLGAYLIRLRKTDPSRLDLDEAAEVLEPASRHHRGDFFIQSNLGTLFQLQGKLDAARGPLVNAESLAPPEYKSHARYQRRLVEWRLGNPGEAGLQPVDNLLGLSPRLYGDWLAGNRLWEVGRMPEEGLRELPGGSLAEAIAIVQQLLLALPDDARLHWLLGELANAQGDEKAAALAMHLAVDNFRHSARLLRQRRALLEEVVTWKTYFERVGGWQEQQEWLLQALGAGLQSAGSGGDLFQQALWQCHLARKPKAFEETVAGPEGSPALAALSNLGWRGWSIIAVGAGLICLLVTLQVRQLRRRARAA
jgi:tetratricopeptide (TPR) repeat protein